MKIKQSLCEICTCGKHLCSCLRNSEENEVPYSMLTEYQDNFLAHYNTPISASVRPQNEWKPLEGTISNITTFRLDYVPHEVSRRSPKAATVYVRPDGTMMLTSTYAADFKEYDVQKHIVNKTKERNSPATKVVGASPCKVTRENITLDPEAKDSLPFDGTTNYNLHYVRHPTQSRQLREKEKYRSPTAPFSGLSTYNGDYRGLFTQAPEPFMVKAAWEENRTPFQGTTEFRDKYKPWPPQPKQPHKKELYHPPGGAIDFLSTVQASYVPHPRQPVLRVRPSIHTWEKAQEPFLAKSVTKEDFQAWDGELRVAHARGMGKPSASSQSATAITQHTGELTERPGTPSTEPLHIMSSPESIVKDPAYCTGTPRTQGVLSPSCTGTPQTRGVLSPSCTETQVERCAHSFAQPPGFERICSKVGRHRLYRTISGEDTSLAHEMVKKGRMSSQRQTCSEPSTKDRGAHFTPT